MVVDCAPNGVAYVRDLDPKNYSVLLALGPRETLAIEIMYGKYLLRPRNSIWGPRFEKNCEEGYYDKGQSHRKRYPGRS